ncbi:MAG: flagellar hook-associated protein FlgL [Candidatus Accumulibacter sp.]|jgi:flagellar hook-associated protein 3 FlgL|nr:flagellar hook-associated protein FlgL [Accumulibacter sp.]
MRISTSQIFQTGASRLMDGQSKLYKLQNQLSTEKKFLTAQDDPVAAAQVLITSHALGVNTQYADNQANAASQLGLEETRLQSVIDSIQYIMEQAVAGSNQILSDSQREYFAKDWQGQFEFLLGMANSADANGYYLFSGYQGHTQPFQKMANGVVAYVGDSGQRLLQVGASRQIAVSDSGYDIFQAIRTGNGTFAMTAAAANTGTGVIGGGTVTDITAWTGDNYQIQFTSPTNFTVTDTTTSTVVGSYTYTAGTSITAIPGISFSIGGNPAAGDTFDISPSTDQSLFTTLGNMIAALSTDIAGNPVAAASVQNILNAERANLDRALENMSTVQASIGSRRVELNELTDVSSMLDLQYKERISNLEDIDWAEVISAFTQQQTQLEAAQSSFARITSLSLFNYL